MRPTRAGNRPAQVAAECPPVQSSIEGFKAAPRPTDRLFFAILPDANAAERLSQLAQRLRGEHSLQGRPFAKNRFHTTLLFLGDYVGLPQNIVTMASEAAATVRMPSFDLAFDRAVSFSGRSHNRPFVLLAGDGVPAVTAFRQALDAAMTKSGVERRQDARFVPHVTLLYDDRSIAEQPVEPIGWTAREFVLVRSLLGRTQHVPLGRWPIRNS